MEENFNKMNSSIGRPKPQAIIKTYVLQFIYQNGNGWAFVNATSVNQAETVFKTQTRYKEAKVTNIKEARWYGDNMQVVFEGAVTTYPTVDLDKIVSKEDLKKIIEDTIKDNLPDLGLEYCTEAQVQQIVSGAIENLSPPDLTEYYTAAEVNKAIKVAINNLPIVPGPQGPIGPQGPQGPQGAAGHSPNITINAQGYWVIDGVPTETSAIGPKGEDGKDGEDGTAPDMSEYMTSEEVQAAIDDAIEGITPGGGGSYGPVDDEVLQELIDRVNTLQTTFNAAVTNNNVSTPVGTGTFQQAYNKSKETGMSTTLFNWLLNDTDDQGRRVKKLIYHIGNGEFIDAIGAKILGKLNGLTIICKGEASFTINSTTIPLHAGTNNFTKVNNSYLKSDLGEQYNVLSSGKIDGMSFNTKANIVDVDFGGIPVKGGYIFSGGNFTSLRSVCRMNVYGEINQCFKDNSNIRYIQIYSDAVVTHTGSNEIFSGTNNVQILDLKNLKLKPEKLSSYFESCGATTYDLRNIDTNSMASDKKTISKMFYGSNVRTVIIGENFNITSAFSKASVFNSTPSDSSITLVCLSQTPPGNVQWFPNNITIKIPPGTTDNYIGNNSSWKNFITDEEKHFTIEEFREGEYDYNVN